MGSYLADTNLLLRLADPGSEQHAVTTRALAHLLGRGDEVYLTPQNFIEFWAVATRPVDANGFGWSSERTAKELSELRERFPMLPDSPEIFDHWFELVQRFSVNGKRVHDARLVAVLQAHRVEHLVTFNTQDFALFPFLSLLHPRQLATTAQE
jgi:predicted nucleic acid-binding protein